jgi:protein-S-isoprenylcysteine O-methyltransferase Ste14
MPLWVQVVGLLGYATSLGLGGWAMSENRFFSEVVRIQRDRGHYVATSGPYRYVRHPSYLGTIVAVPFMALALGSW